MSEKEKYGGRSKGTLNKKTRDLYEIMDRLECNPFEVLLHFAKGDYKALGLDPKASTNENMQDIINNAIEGFVDDGHTDKEIEEIEKAFLNPISPELMQKSAKDACEYLFPKRKAIEIKDDREAAGFASLLQKAALREIELKKELIKDDENVKDIG